MNRENTGTGPLPAILPLPKSTHAQVLPIIHEPTVLSGVTATSEARNRMGLHPKVGSSRGHTDRHYLREANSAGGKAASSEPAVAGAQKPHRSYSLAQVRLGAAGTSCWVSGAFGLDKNQLPRKDPG